MTVQEINIKWGAAFLNTLTAQDAAIIFCFGMTKDKKVRICATDDLTPAELITALKGIVTILEGKKP